MKLYTTVMDDVISGVRESFLDEGVDEQVLQELKSIWEKKLSESKAVELNPDPPEPQPPALSSHKSSSKSSKKNANANSNAHAHTNANTNATTSNIHVTPHQIIQEARESSPPAILPDIELPTQQHVQQIPQQIQQPRHQLPAQPQLQPQPVRLQQVQNLVQNQIQQHPQQVANQNNGQVSIQIKLPGHNNLPERLINVIVPPIAIQGNQLHSIFSGPVITAAIALPVPFATSLLQQHVNSTYENTPGFIPGPVPHPVQFVPQAAAANAIPQQQLVQAMAQQQGHIAQLDGAAGDSSDDDDEEEEEENDDEEDIDEDKEDDENDPGAREEEPLNSEDDVTDDDPVDLFDTDNVVVCQYDKITRSRNKWKFYLKDGIMNLNGKDFVFQKANGDAEW